MYKDKYKRRWVVFEHEKCWMDVFWWWEGRLEDSRRKRNEKEVGVEQAKRKKENEKDGFWVIYSVWGGVVWWTGEVMRDGLKIRIGVWNVNGMDIGCIEWK